MNESLKNKHRIEHLLKGDILDLGAGRWPICKEAITYDRDIHRGQGCRAAVIGDARGLVFPDECFDVVHSSHLLEDLVDTHAALTEWLRVLRYGGHLILYLPHRDYYPNVGQPHANTDHQHDFIPDDIVGHLDVIGGTTVITNKSFAPPGGKYNPSKSKTDECSFLIVARKGNSYPTEMVVNACAGGFGLTLKAEEWMTSKGFKWDEWAGMCYTEEFRTHPILIECVRAFTPQVASAPHSMLKIITINEPVQIIDGHGREKVQSLPRVIFDAW